MAGETFNYEEAQLESWDFVVLFLYFASILGVGIWVSVSKTILRLYFKPFSLKSSRKSRQNSEDDENPQNTDQVGGYFLASKSMHFIPVRNFRL